MTDYAALGSGLIVPDHVAADLHASAKRPTCVDLFAGCGGASCGFIQAGYEVVAAVDSDPGAAATFMSNLGSYPCQFVFVENSDRKAFEKFLSRSFKRKDRDQIEIAFTSGSGWISGLDPRPPGCGVFFLGDVRKINGTDILNAVGLKVGELDCVVGGPPCQGFSRAGKQNVMDPRNSLIFEFARLVIEMHPKAMVMENVPGILNMVTPEGLPVIDAFCRILKDGGFAGYDALKRSMQRQGSIGLVGGEILPSRSEKRKRKQQPVELDEEPEEFEDLSEDTEVIR